MWVCLRVVICNPKFLSLSPSGSIDWTCRIYCFLNLIRVRKINSTASLPCLDFWNNSFITSFSYFVCPALHSRCQMLFHPLKKTDTPPTLANFLLPHCACPSYCDLVDLTSLTFHTNKINRCAIYLSMLVSNDSNIMKVNWDCFHHISDVCCISRYIIFGFNRCSLCICRKIWFALEDVVAGKTSDQARIH